MTKRSWMWMIAGAVLASPVSGAAQGPMGEQGMRAWHEEQLTDFETIPRLGRSVPGRHVGLDPDGRRAVGA